MAKKRQTLADYMVIALSPALIIVLLASLVFFLLEISYEGDFSGRLTWVMFWYVLATVLIARISIEEGRERAALFGFALAGAMGLVIFQFVGLAPVAFGLLALVWWCANKLTYDCTLIDENEDASGQGLLQAAGLGSVEGAAAPPANAPAKGGSDKGSGDAGSADAGQTSPAPWQRFVAWARGRGVKKSAPGVWVVYFSLAALPLFGLGQALVPAVDLERRRYIFWLLFIYLGSGLGLLLTTSFLGLRRYLRQRNLQMPPAIAGVWLGVGGVMAATLLLLCALVPRPSAEYRISSVSGSLGARDPQASRYAVMRDSPAKGKGASSSETPRNPSQTPPEQTGGSQGTRPGAGGNSSQQPGNSSQTSQNGGQPGTSQSNGTQTGGGQSSGNQSSGSQSSQKQSNEKQSNENQSSGNQSSGNQSSGNQSNGNQSSGNQSAGSQPSGNQPGQNQSNGNQPKQNGDQPDQNQPNQKQADDQSDQKGGNGSTSSSRDRESERSSQGRRGGAGAPAAGGQPTGNSTTPTENASSSQPSSKPFEFHLPSFGAWGLTLFRWLLNLLLLAALIYAVWRYWPVICRWVQEFLQALRDLWARLFGGKTPVAAEAVAAAAPALRRPGFADYPNPFQSGAAHRTPPDALVRYSFDALQAWAADRHLARRPEETPLEFAASLGGHVPDLARDTQELAMLYARLAYARGALPATCLPTLERFWSQLSAADVPAASA